MPSGELPITSLYPPQVVYGINWYDKFTEEVKEMNIGAGNLVLVEVHGLPDNKVESFTYRATYQVQPGQQVLVPAPDWSIRVTGRAELPGFVLGRSDEQSVAGLRDILPQPSYPATWDQITKLTDQWTKEATGLQERSLELSAQARQYEDAAETIFYRIRQLKSAAGI